MPLTIEQSPYGITGDGQSVDRYQLGNSAQTLVDIISWGGIISSWVCNDRDGRADNIVLGYDTLAEYEACGIYMGCIAGRYANRIAHGRFALDGHSYQLEQNDGEHHLHGGTCGFHKVVWQTHIDGGDNPSLVLSHRSHDGAGGYPGTLDVSIRYTLNEESALTISYTATSDKPTVVNLTSHSYFNLRGHQFAAEDGVLDHELQLNAHAVVQVDEDAIPTGKVMAISGTPFDFTARQPIGQQLKTRSDSYDHCYVLDGSEVASILSDPVSGRSMQIRTTLPGMQLYSSGFVDGCRGRAGAVYGRRGAVCLETQLFPDAPNRPSFPSAVLRPGEVWSHSTTYWLTHLPDTI